MNNPKVSVIIPAYNVEKYIRACIDCIINQTFKDIEIIVVDDGSSDKTLSILQAYDNIHIISKSNGGASSARNVGLKEATGTYIYFMDGDDTIELDTIEAMYLQMQEKKLDQLIMSPKNYFDDKEEDLDDIYNRDYRGVFTGKELFRRIINNVHFCSGPPFRMIRKDIIDQYNLRFFEGIIFEDELFTFKLLMVCQRVGMINRRFYNRTFREDSVTASYNAERAFQSYEAIFTNMVDDAYWADSSANELESINRYLKERFNECNDYYYTMEANIRNNYKDKYRTVLRHARKCNCFNSIRVRVMCQCVFLYKLYYRILGLKN